MNLETRRLFLRPVSVNDAPDLFVARGDAETMRYWDWPPAASAGDIAQVIREHFREIDGGETQWWAVAHTPRGPAIGECDLSEIDYAHCRAEIGFLFQRAQWGQGFAHEAMERVLRYAFEDLNLERLWARVHAGNDASVRLLARLGFAPEGLLRGHVLRDGARRDCLLFGLNRAR
jgi:[ribosomal protein S5]-alanine N-acetyltransferase